MDYDIQLNDVIQLMIKPAVNDGASTSKASDENLEGNELIDVESAYYKVGDAVDIQDSMYGAWFEYILIEIKAMRKDVGEGGKVDDKNIQYIGGWEL